jgi:beta-lactamase class A
MQLGWIRYGHGARDCAETRQSDWYLKGFAAALAILMSCGGCRYNPESLDEMNSRVSLDTAAVEALADSLEGENPGLTIAVFASDPSSGQRFERRSERVFHAASTMKVPVMIEVMRQVHNGHFALSDSIVVRNEFSSIVDGSPYSMDIAEDSDDSVYGRVGERMSIRDLVVQMITVSSNLATNILIDKIGADSVQATSERLGTTTMRVLRGVEDLKAYDAGLNNTATASDLGVLLERIAARTAVSPEFDADMIEIMLAQEFGKMIPAGLPAGTPVAHKTGSITRINHDAAIVSPDASPYVLVILTEGIDDHDVSSEMGARITAEIHRAFRPGGSDS